MPDMTPFTLAAGLWTVDCRPWTVVDPVRQRAGSTRIFCRP